MKKPKRKLTPAQKAAKRQRQKEYMTIFIRGKQVRVKRPETIDGLSVDEFIARNADPVWLTQNEMWEELGAWEEARDAASGLRRRDEPKTAQTEADDQDSDIPF